MQRSRVHPAMSLQHKLSIILFALLTTIGLSTWYLAKSTADLYSLEFYQRLNMPIAMYMAGEKAFIQRGIVDRDALTELAHHVMVVNPSLEIYLLDVEGKVVAHALDEQDVELTQVDLGPIHQFLSRSEQSVLLGDDPRNSAQQNIFTVHPLIEDDQVQGYLYAILAGKNFQALLADVSDSHTLVNAAAVLLWCLILALIAGVVAFYFLTRRLRHLRSCVNAIDLNAQVDRQAFSLPKSRQKDEIDSLIQAFESLLDQNQQQYQQLEEADSNRRELVANISHDLRTPLTSMQGFIETLLIKGAELDEKSRQELLTIAHKQSKRMGQLVAELFELAKLDSGAHCLNLETFSLLEIVYDLMQDFELQARDKHISLKVVCVQNDVLVRADIRLIQRVFENLIANALRYTPQHGEVSIVLDTEQSDQVMVHVANSGKVIPETERKYIFQRYYQAHDSTQHAPHDKDHSGIGLAIVDKILQLHNSKISLSEHKQDGAEFIFALTSA